MTDSQVRDAINIKGRQMGPELNSGAIRVAGLIARQFEPREMVWGNQVPID